MNTVELLGKAAIGAIVVLAIQLLARSSNYTIAGLVPLFPTFMLISNYIVGTERTTTELKETVLFGLCSLFPYAIYLVALYLLVDRVRLGFALLGATLCWFAAATVLVVVWNNVMKP